MPKLVINGAKGRMGQAVEACALESPQWEIVGRVDIGDDLVSAIKDAEVVIDFSAPSAIYTLVEVCKKRQIPIVSGTTGLSVKEMQLLEEASKVIPIVWSSNFSIGVNALFWLVEQAQKILGQGFDIEIVELHHKYKKDSPSGTALTLANILAKSRGISETAFTYGRYGMKGPREENELGLHAIRGGDVVGEHMVIFLGMGERLELIHRASSRKTFALGALRAAGWVIDKRPALYSMLDVLGLK